MTCACVLICECLCLSLPLKASFPPSHLQRQICNCWGKKKSAKNLFMKEMTDDFKLCVFLSYVSRIRCAPCACPCLCAYLCASTTRPQNHFSTRSSRSRSWGGGRGTTVMHFTVWLGAKAGLSRPRMRRTLRGTERSAQLGVAPSYSSQPPTEAQHHGTWLVGSCYWWAQHPKICFIASQRSSCHLFWPNKNKKKTLLRALLRRRQFLLVVVFVF